MNFMVVAGGRTNLLKYALGLEPKVNESGALGETFAADAEWKFAYPRPSGITDVIYTIQVSADGAIWTDVAQERVDMSATWELWQARSPRNGEGGVVFRILVRLR